jgi:hypothetical protein
MTVSYLFSRLQKNQLGQQTFAGLHVWDKVPTLQDTQKWHSARPQRVKKTEVEAKVEKACFLVLSLNLILNLYTLVVFSSILLSINGVMPERQP